MPEPTFDPTDSDLNVGIELEYPALGRGDERFVDRGRPSNELQSAVSRLPSRLNATPTYDGTVGLEVVSDVLALDEIVNWYHEVLDYLRVEYNADFQPTGLMSSGSTAGLHMHLSSLSSDKARDLFEISQQPWAKVLFCSSIATSDDGSTWPVFRGGSYCHMRFNSGSRYDCVNGRGAGHYEWRMPEPVTPEHMEIVMNFLLYFEQDTDLAIEYAQEVLDDADDRITAIKRAEAVGMDLNNVRDVRRSPASVDPENFYEAVESDWALPNIYTVELDGDYFYGFESQLEGEFEAAGVEAHTNDVLWADDLAVVDDPSLREDVRSALRSRNQNQNRKTEATDELKKIIDKKKTE